MQCPIFLKNLNDKEKSSLASCRLYTAVILALGDMTAVFGGWIAVVFSLSSPFTPSLQIGIWLLVPYVMLGLLKCRKNVRCLYGLLLRIAS